MNKTDATPTNEERLKGYEESVWMNIPEFAELARIARQEMERANRRGELLKDAKGRMIGFNFKNIRDRIQKEIDQ